MSVERVRRSLLATSCVAAPLAGLVALFAVPALHTIESAGCPHRPPILGGSTSTRSSSFSAGTCWSLPSSGW